jgi:hypothetical protein
MRIIIQIAVLIFLTELLSSCSAQNEQKPTLNTTDSLWLKFASAMEEKNLDFLLANSLDSISCVDCEPSNSGSDRKDYRAEYLFKMLMPELMHLADLSTAEFSTFEDSTSIKVNYSIKWNSAPEGGYNLIFVLKKRNGKYLLTDRIFVP